MSGGWGMAQRWRWVTAHGAGEPVARKRGVRGRGEGETAAESVEATHANTTRRDVHIPEFARVPRMGYSVLRTVDEASECLSADWGTGRKSPEFRHDSGS
jgi:hypothetical protein